ncbi:uncharacterized protein LOC130740165 [Lotus japonicus]|uniref:Uncharacterized protein n=1 Tax=Lotus japonicus TaxID=34305 RepID=I3T773_LOTJA|nr:uncharacterized protein LOC130740165 [Lotus japonicus]AFK48365.1 unknown [Lotus japonicus]
MHRQSLGSPVSKLHGHGVAIEDATVITADEPPKPHRLSSPLPAPQHKFIHIIPVLTVLCFLILFLCSHTPSPSDLDNFAGFKHSRNPHLTDSATEISGGIEHYMEAKRSDVLAIRTLQQIPKPRLHRKLADF